MPFKSMKNKVNEFLENKENIILFLHIREPIISNISDKNVFDYNYDYVIKNNDTLDELKNKAKEFVENLEE